MRKIWVLAIFTAPLLGGCAGVFQDDDQLSYNAMPHENGRNVVQDSGQKPLECVPYVRDHSGVKIFGDAYTWWQQAADKYQRTAIPETGAVLVLSGYAGPDRGHVAVVDRVVSSREIRVDHANWLDDGSIYLNDPVVDVSADNDWSAVRVFNIKTGAWGGNTYPVQGFILSPEDTAPTPDADAPVPVMAHFQKPLPKPRAAPHLQAAPQAPPPEADAPLGPHDLTPEDRALEPDMTADPGPVAVDDASKKLVNSGL